MVVRVDLTPVAPTVKENKSIQLTARAYDEGDREVTGKTVAWASSNHGIALVNAAGRVTGVHLGTATITATVDGVEAELDVVVNQADVSAVYVLGGPFTLSVGDLVTLQVQAVDDTGTVLQGRTIAWSSSDPNVASVDSTGTATAVAAGVATITASTSGRQGQAMITVTPRRPAVQLAMGETHTCALLRTGEIWCWGSNDLGQLGMGAEGDDEFGAVQATIGLSFRSISAGSDFTCGVTLDDEVYCWGENGNLELGDPFLDYSVVPLRISSSSFSSMASGYYSNCATNLQGNPYCWGYNSSDHELGSSSTDESEVPLQVQSPGAGQPLLELSLLKSSVFHTCGVTSSGDLYCWGFNNSGRLGIGHDSVVSRPVRPPLPGPVDAFGLGGSHTCAITSAGTTYCWGANYSGQLGSSASGSQTYSPNLVTPPSGVTFVAITGGSSHTCALDSTGVAWCWGENGNGQLGRPGGSASSPVRVAGGLTFAAIEARDEQTCAVATDGTIYCWGSNARGQLGIGNPLVNSVSVPTAVQF
ncbi:Ig-like domain-containing protein [Vulgatibacter incomptus]|uniref:BIG2 domain-containing protein n=1 Tax=Vulgatibacter incomptus TaxID=1391653 RepID=A0A0K1PCZ4_9BACT|nr:Ig-like domain-containing protein [Vulgatibacter incomptus]AKU90994.1 hypothetical protein AKJ08_1381 [Vulgatibacter incomptus]